MGFGRKKDVKKAEAVVVAPVEKEEPVQTEAKL
jgi:hypothetical protein